MSTVHIRTDDLIGVDLNLVVAFDALAREQSVTRAAHRLGVTQSAVSHALRRLRDLLGDPLLVRGRGGMVLTPRAQALVVPVRTGLLTLQRALSQSAGFDPATAKRAFAIVSPDLFDLLMMPALLERMGRDAPGVDIAVVAADERRLPERLETGEVDIAVVPRIVGVQREDPPGVLRRTLLHDTFTCFMRADHPALGRARRRTLALDTYVGLSHALVGEGLGFVDRALEAKGLTRRIAVRVPTFYAALSIVAHSDLVLTGPNPLRRLGAGLPPITALAPPLPLPEHALDLLWHERFTKDPAHAWLRTSITDVVRDVLR
jgi:DNA-binding transcriptional LysR family regulator